MADDIKYEKQDMFEELAIKALKKLNDSFASIYPYLDYASMYMHDKKEIQGVPMLFGLHDYYFIGYILKFDSEIEVAVARRMTNTDFEHYDCFMKIPRFAYALSLSRKQSCISIGKIANFVSNLPVGSFIQVTGVDGTQAIGFFQGLSSGKIELAFGYDLEAGKLEKTTELSLYRREKLDESFSFPERSLDIILCRQVHLLQTKEGVSDTSLIPNEEQVWKIYEETRKEMMGLFLARKPSEMIVEFDCIRGRIFHVNNGDIIEVSTFPGAISGNVLSRFKGKASLDQAEHEETQSGNYVFSESGEECKIQMVITYPEPGCYSISLVADFARENRIHVLE